MYGARAHNYENDQWDQFQRGGCTHQARATCDTADVNERYPPNDAHYYRNAHESCVRLRKKACSYVGQGRCDAATGKHATDPEQHAGDVAGKRAECGLNIAVNPATGRDPT